MANEYDDEVLKRDPKFVEKWFDRVRSGEDVPMPPVANIPLPDPPEGVRRFAPPELRDENDRRSVREVEEQQTDEEHQENFRLAVKQVITMHTEELEKKHAESKAQEPPVKQTRNQTIAAMIVALPYREAIAMGVGIAQKLKIATNGLEVGPEILTRAIQDWAWEGDIMKDDERPTNGDIIPKPLPEVGV